jgi:hypothetical protein
MDRELLQYTAANLLFNGARFFWLLLLGWETAAPLPIWALRSEENASICNE